MDVTILVTFGVYLLFRMGRRQRIRVLTLPVKCPVELVTLKCSSEEWIWLVSVIPQTDFAGPSCLPCT